MTKGISGGYIVQYLVQAKKFLNIQEDANSAQAESKYCIEASYFRVSVFFGR